MDDNMAVRISSETRKYGRVRMFNGHPDKLFGFARVENSSLEVFFHLEARLSFAEDDHYPKNGEWISFEMLATRRGMKAIAWQLEPDYIPPAIVTGARQHFDLSELPEICEEQLDAHDQIAGEVSCANSDLTAEWFEIIYRPFGDQLFKIRCWDRGTSSFQTRLSVGATLPGVTFGNKDAFFPV